MLSDYYCNGLQISALSISTRNLYHDLHTFLKNTIGGWRS